MNAHVNPWWGVPHRVSSPSPLNHPGDCPTHVYSHFSSLGQAKYSLLLLVNHTIPTPSLLSSGLRVLRERVSDSRFTGSQTGILLILWRINHPMSSWLATLSPEPPGPINHLFQCLNEFTPDSPNLQVSQMSNLNKFRSFFCLLINGLLIMYLLILPKLPVRCFL